MVVSLPQFGSSSAAVRQAETSSAPLRGNHHCRTAVVRHHYGSQTGRPPSRFEAASGGYLPGCPNGCLSLVVRSFDHHRTMNAERSHDLLTIAEAALLMRLSTPTLRRLIGQGVVPTVQVGGPNHAVRVKREDLDRLLEASPREAA